jgi:hypothetical protein
MSANHAGLGARDGPRRLDEEMTELCVFVPASQAAALERLALARGSTLGQLLRSLIRDHLAAPPGPVSVPE